MLIPAGVAVDDPIVLSWRAEQAATFPYALIVASEGSRATIVSRIEGGAFESALVSEIVEVVVKSDAELNFASAQLLDSRARSFSTKRAKIGQNGRVNWSVADLGAGLCVSDVRSMLEQPGVETSIAGIFFADENQHLDIQSEVDHRIGDTRSETLFKSAATGRGQARYMGNIRIHPHAHGSEATLRDDALVLSKTAHIDSIPALEIAANDVKAYHGATVGAIGLDEIFYAMSRGIARQEAERMIALGFFEPAIARFPGEALRAELREQVGSKLG